MITAIGIAIGVPFGRTVISGGIPPTSPSSPLEALGLFYCPTIELRAFEDAGITDNELLFAIALTF